MTSKKRKVQKLKQDPFIPQPNGKKRLWAFRLTAMIAVPLILFACLELGLRLGGVGYSTEIATKQTVNGTDRYCYNLKLGCPHIRATRAFVVCVTSRPHQISYRLIHQRLDGVGQDCFFDGLLTDKHFIGDFIVTAVHDHGGDLAVGVDE